MTLKVGVFGWYMYGNFGDEVMAVMIGRTLKANGYRPVLYKLPRYLADAEDLETVDTISSSLPPLTVAAAVPEPRRIIVTT